MGQSGERNLVSMLCTNTPNVNSRVILRVCHHWMEEGNEAKTLKIKTQNGSGKERLI